MVPTCTYWQLGKDGLMGCICTEGFGRAAGGGRSGVVMMMGTRVKRAGLDMMVSEQVRGPAPA